MKKNLLILGAGQFGRLVYELASESEEYATISFLDDGSPEAIGTLDASSMLVGEYTHAVVAIGNNKLRTDMLRHLASLGYELPCIVGKGAYLSPSARVGCGTVVEPLAVVATGASVGVGCIISSGAVIRHNAIVGCGCHVNCGAVVMSGAILRDWENVGANEVYS